MDMIFAAMIGWCGTRWWRWPFPPHPDPDPEPWWRSLLIGAIGAVTGILTVAALGPSFPNSGMYGTALLAFAGGKVGSDILGGLLNMAMGKR